MEKDLPKGLKIFAEEARIKVEGLSKEELIAKLDKLDPQWVDEINNGLELPISEDQMKEMWKQGYNFVNLYYLSGYGLTYGEMKAMTPAEVDEMADLFAESDDKLLGC